MSRGWIWSYKIHAFTWAVLTVLAYFIKDVGGFCFVLLLGVMIYFERGSGLYSIPGSWHAFYPILIFLIWFAAGIYLAKRDHYGVLFSLGHLVILFIGLIVAGFAGYFGQGSQFLK